MKTLSTLLAVFVAAGALSAEDGPKWWSNPGTMIYQSNSTISNYSPANLAQLKNVARRAKHYLDRSLAAQGGAGPSITALVLSFEPRANQNYTSSQVVSFKLSNLAPINLGQAKAVAKLYYDRLLAVGYNTKSSLVHNGFTASWAFDYPWNPGTPVAENYKPLNIGQLKLMFSFTFDLDQNGLEDYWELQYFGSTGQSASANPDGDEFTNQQESDLWMDPLTFSGTDVFDTNGDGIFDAFAETTGYSITDLDVDDDGMLNAIEYANGTNPFWFDTDGDGIGDGLDRFPFDGTQTQFPSSGGDTVAPLITLFTPENVTLVP